MSSVHFDTTLGELYGLDKQDPRGIYLFYMIPTATLQMTQGIPISKKYVYQDTLSPKNFEIQARIFTQIAPQLFGFIAGNLNIIMFDLDAPDGGIDPQPRKDTQDVLSCIAESQRPLVTYVRSVEDIILPPDTLLAVANPMDCLEHFPSTVPFENHYRALSKRDLVGSGLPTPESIIVETRLSPMKVRDPQTRIEEVNRMLEVIKYRSMPFVVKLPQACSGQGVFLVRNEEERSSALSVLETGVDTMLQQLSPSNEHLHPSSLIVQEMLSGSAVAIALFLSREGEVYITSVCDQFVDAQGNWGGGHIDYAAQERLIEEYRAIAKKIGDYMHTLAYYGPLGADIMVDAKGNHVVIDLNARVTGSHALGFLKGHFNRERGFSDAAILFPLVGGVQRKVCWGVGGGEDGRCGVVSWKREGGECGDGHFGRGESGKVDGLGGEGKKASDGEVLIAETVFGC
ncbi:hypothetical protein BGAL_0089g00120 [Botrytis galanthina]|uniref:ATP-grasp domain-containing protein n=1 Tax=Botrytis galanthina TaxID=278940 RepID=A0A4V4HV58_9HELO|nr:hypothetical protein BGAL_0089g00120 [Botrytis galanthina]